MTLHFEQILETKEYKKLIHNSKYLFVEYHPYRFIFFKEKTTIKCFSIEMFCLVDSIELYNILFSYSLSDFIAVSNHDVQMELVFEASDLSKNLGECLEIQSLDSIEFDNLFNPEHFEHIKMNLHIMPWAHWKFSIKQQLFYFVAPNMCVEFNSNMFRHYGNTHYLMNNDKDNIRCYISPYTLLAHYNLTLVHSKSNLQIGYNQEVDCTLVFRGNHNELKHVLNICCNKLNAFTTINNSVVSLHLKNEKFSSFNNQYLKQLNQVYNYEIAEFENTSGSKITNSPYKILPKKEGGVVYPIIVFDNTITHIQIVLEICIKDLLEGYLNLENITYNKPSFISMPPTEFIANTNPVYDEN